jgi:hypothetical protein
MLHKAGAELETRVDQTLIRAAAVNLAMAQQEGEQLLAFAAPIIGRCLAGPNRVASGTQTR